MKVRVLPKCEWARLESRGGMLPFVRDEDAKPVVVEKDGKIVASVLVVNMTQAEAIWISPDYRSNPGVTRALLRGMGKAIREFGRPWLLVCCTEDMVAYLRRMGGVALPLRPHVLAIGEID